jgi:hypothetical protein
MIDNVALKPSLTIWFIAILLIINGSLAIYSTPITDIGDAGSYISFSRVLLGQEEANHAHRSPLYSIIMAGFMLIFSPPLLFKIIVVFQYFLVLITAWLVYLIFRPLFSRAEPAMIIALLFNISLSTVYYANIIQTEILTVFLSIGTIYFLIRIFEKFSYKDLSLLSICIGLLSLARYNTIPLVLTIAVLIGYYVYKQRFSLSGSVNVFLLLSIPYIIIINLWCVYNAMNNGFYGLFPTSSGINRNVVVSSIRSENKVTEEYLPVLNIFLRARAEYLEKPIQTQKGSLAKYGTFGILTDLYSGYPIYLTAYPELRQHFNFLGNEGEYEMGLALAPFYREISSQSRLFILKMRFVSLISGFRAAATSLPPEYGRTNTNILPSFLIELYKISIFVISVFVFFAFFGFIFNVIKTRHIPNMSMLVLFSFVISYWFINFYFATVSDANRFKFPAEPVIIGLFIYYFSLILDRKIINLGIK